MMGEGLLADWLNQHGLAAARASIVVTCAVSAYYMHHVRDGLILMSRATHWLQFVLIALAALVGLGFLTPGSAEPALEFFGWVKGHLF